MSMNDTADHAIAHAPAEKSSIEAWLFAGIAIFLAAVTTATVIWGPVGLAMSALACVPVMYAAIILITVGK